jgi:hypothetical protein
VQKEVLCCALLLLCVCCVPGVCLLRVWCSYGYAHVPDVRMCGAIRPAAIFSPWPFMV